MSATWLPRCHCIGCQVEKQHIRYRKEVLFHFSGLQCLSVKDPLLKKAEKGEISVRSSSSTIRKEGWIMKWEAILLMGTVDLFGTSVSKCTLHAVWISIKQINNFLKSVLLCTVWSPFPLTTMMRLIVPIAITGYNIITNQIQSQFHQIFCFVKTKFWK